MYVFYLIQLYVLRSSCRMGGEMLPPASADLRPRTDAEGLAKPHGAIYSGERERS